MKKIISSIIVFALVAYSVVYGEFSDVGSEPKIKNTANVINENLKVHYIDVGQGDAILIESDDKNMLIDAGNNNDGKLLVDYIKKQNINDFEYVVGTHAHEDHIGGMDDIIRNFNIKRFFMPNVITTTKTFETVLDELLVKQIKFETPEIGDIYYLGDAKIEILFLSNEEKDLNNNSIILRLDYKDTSFLFTGDAEKKVEKEILNKNIKADVLKLGHHGSRYSTGKDFFAKVNPSIGIISVGDGNKYNHPHQETLETTKNIDVYKTNEVGSIIVKSDGKNLGIETIKTNTNG